MLFLRLVLCYFDEFGNHAGFVRREKNGKADFLASLSGQLHKVAIWALLPKLTACAVVTVFGRISLHAVQTVVRSVPFCSSVRQETHETPSIHSFLRRTKSV